MYRLIGRLEQGQLADLFRAERVETHEPVVVKLFHPKTSDAAYARALGEFTRSLAGVSHPGVARVLDVGLVGSRLAVVRQDTGPYTLGLALQRLNTREVLLPPALALTLVLELLDTIGAAHGQGLVHGALTPGNVLLSEEGRLSVAEFGALAALLASPALRKTFAGRGRSSYRAPELKAGDAATVASDVYALGAIAYELLTLREASTGQSQVSTRQERLPPPSRLVRRLHSRIDPVLMRALEASPTRRHRSCAEFAEGLRDFLAASGGIPPREDVKKFVAELFPNEVQVATLGPVPFADAFSLDDVAGVGALDEAPAELEERASFSGGVVDERTPTIDGLPAITEETAAPPREEHRTQPEVPAVAAPVAQTQPLTWDAPAAPLAPTEVAPASPARGDEVQRRVRVVDDFGPAQDAPKVEASQAPPSRRAAAKTITTFAVPFKRPGDPSVPSYEAMEQRGRRQVRVVSLVASLVLTGTVFGVAWAWYRSQSDPTASLISYLPVPIQREVAPGNRHKPPPVSDVKLKLADFDALHPDKAFNPNPPEPTPPTPPEPKDEPAPKPTADCHAGPKRGGGFLSVSAAMPVRVEIDGKRVCGSTAKVPVSAGSHKVRLTEPRSKQAQDSTVRIQAGKTLKLSPVFRKR